MMANIERSSNVDLEDDTFTSCLGVCGVYGGGVGQSFAGSAFAIEMTDASSPQLKQTPTLSSPSPPSSPLKFADTTFITTTTHPTSSHSQNVYQDDPLQKEN